MIKVLDYGLQVSEFELQLRCHFLGKSMHPLIPRTMSQIVSLLFYYKEDFRIK